MNLAAAVRTAYRRAPGMVRGTVTFTDPLTLAETSAEATANPARGTAADGFEATTTIRQTTLVLAVMPDGLAFAPAPTHYADWQGVRYSVLSAVPVQPAGTVLFYRVTVQR